MKMIGNAPQPLVLLEPSADVHAGHLRHADVQEDEIGRVGHAPPRWRACRSATGRGTKAAALEDRGQESQVLGSVVHDRGRCCLARHRSWRSPFLAAGGPQRRSRRGPPSAEARGQLRRVPRGLDELDDLVVARGDHRLRELSRSSGERTNGLGERSCSARPRLLGRSARRRSPSSTSRTFRVSRSGEGLAEKRPASSTPWWTMASSV